MHPSVRSCSSLLKVWMAFLNAISENPLFCAHILHIHCKILRVVFLVISVAHSVNILSVITWKVVLLWPPKCLYTNEEYVHGG